jgi:hypothetical protein
MLRRGLSASQWKFAAHNEDAKDIAVEGDFDLEDRSQSIKTWIGNNLLE